MENDKLNVEVDSRVMLIEVIIPKNKTARVEIGFSNDFFVFLKNDDLSRKELIDSLFTKLNKCIDEAK